MLSDYRAGLEEGQQPFWEKTLEELQFPDSEYNSMQNYGSSVSPEPFFSKQKDVSEMTEAEIEAELNKG